MTEMEKEKAPDVSEEIKEETAEGVEQTAEDATEEAESAAAETAEAEEEAKEDAKASKKKEKADKKKDKDKTKEKIAELEDKVKRQLAEFENFRNRTEKEKTAMFDMGAKSVIEKILPVVDNFERGLMSVPEEEKDGAFCDGMNKIYKQLMTELDSIGVKPIEAIGTEFDPELHNAVMQVESDEFETGIVAQELQKGYRYHDAVVRHSMVAVVS
jgi:molecular chaperone GrpE